MRALVYGAPVILAVVVFYVAHKVMSRIEHRKLIAENDRLHARLQAHEATIESGDDEKAKIIMHYTKMTDNLLAEIAGHEGDNILDLSSQRTRLTHIITSQRP